MIGLFVATYAGSSALSDRRQYSNRIGLLLGGAALLAAAGSLAAVHGAVGHTLGRLAVAALTVWAVWVFLAYPTGRLREPVERSLVIGFALASAILWAVTLALARRLPATGPIYDCRRPCPRNAFDFLKASASTGRALDFGIVGFTAAALLVACLVLVRKAWSPSHLVRRAFVPLVVCVVVWVISYDVFTFLRESGIGAGEKILGPLVAVAALSIPVAICLGQMRSHVIAGDRISRFISGLDAAPGAMEEFLRSVIGDPRLKLLFWRTDRGAYVDVDGEAAAPRAGPREHLLLISFIDGSPRAALIYDSLLSNSIELIEGFAQAALLVRDHSRLVSDLEAARSRVAAAAAEERQRLERDLHDGAQQRLLALQLSLAELRDRLDPALGAKFDAAAAHADAALADIRALGQGIYPASLRDFGLGRALTSLTAVSPIGVRVTDSGVGRSTPAVEHVVYLCVSEAIQNAAKHGGPGIHVTVALRSDGAELSFDVADDGRGFDLDSTVLHSGIANMRDRLTSIGGKLSIATSPGLGTIVHGMIPGALAARAHE